MAPENVRSLKPFTEKVHIVGIGDDGVGFGARLAAPQHGAGQAVGQAVELVAHEGEEGADHQHQA